MHNPVTSTASASQTVTQWIRQLQAGDAAAAERLWQRYFAQMVKLARRKLEGAARIASDEEDVALSAFKSFCLGAQHGRYPKLTDRGSLWSLLVAITAHKSVDLIRRENRLKRGGGAVAATAAGAAFDPSGNLDPLTDYIRDEPTPEFIAMMTEQLHRLLDHLREPELQSLAIAKMEGYSNDELAQRDGCSLRTIERRLKLIREKCRQELLE
jgi:RNA polymerase sigma factor (sigma-70 family)